ncbi:BQ5605_C002g01162 [Microbotryum silenes-dioicae]|uniref:BQ5605_C002g01162 protein n=1 Tax=Microbotryum silenes-dioicae TaxID=796604 RepID=A0A2X0M1U9_9BASI|nr:BQ5605_C002g01162 [Microbotryum silenes-dioicae]
MQENWDCDPDFDLPPSLQVVAVVEDGLPSVDKGDATTSALARRGDELFGPTSATTTGGGDRGLYDFDDDDYGQVLQPHLRTIELVTSTDPFERTAASDVALPPRTKDEDGQQSTSSSRGSTLRGLMNSFSGLSLDSPTPHAENSDPDSMSLQLRQTGETNTTPKSATTIRRGSLLSQHIVMASAGPGRVHHLGSTPLGSAQSVLGDWDEDLVGLDALPLNIGERSLRVKQSFASHISDDPEDERLERGLPTPRSSGKNSMKGSPHRRSSTRSAYTENEDDAQNVESDFDLPSDLGQFTLSKTKLHSRANSAHSQNALGSALPASTPSPNSMSVPALVRGGETASEDDLSDDESFFEDLVIPSYFLGGPGHLTPPSDAEKGGPTNLQEVLKRKLEARGGRGLDDTRSGAIDPKSKAQTTKLASYREDDDHKQDGVAEAGLEITDDIKLGAERLRTRSAPRQPSLLKARRKTTSSAFRTQARLTLTKAPSASTVLPRPGSTEGKPVRRPVSSATGGSSELRSTATRRPPPPVRPASAAGTVDRPHRERRPGPPPAPSAALRDRVRTRPVAVGPTASSTSLAAEATLRIDTSRMDSARIASSSTPITPATPSVTTAASSPAQTASSSRTLSSKWSQGTLLATPSRTIERKRSLQNFASPAPSPSSSRRVPASPTPGYSTPFGSQISSKRPLPTPTTPIAPTSSFALHTAASASRKRERVSSGPTFPMQPPNERTPLPSPSLPSGAYSGRAPPTHSRPSSAASITRLTQPTMASRAKARTVSSTEASMSIPRSPLSFTAFRRSPLRNYGDGSELDAFDDLPTNKEREKMRVSSYGNAAAMKTPIRARRAPAPATVRPPGGNHLVPPASQGSRDAKKARVEGETRHRPTKIKDGKRREPHLIRNLGSHSSVKTHGEMTWNPSLGRWEGNENVLKEFDRVLSSSTRPALITQLSSSLSPGRIAFPSTDDASPTESSTAAISPRTVKLVAASAANIANVKVVGSMVFDPVRMSWHSLAGPDDEDELDLFGDNESSTSANGDGWEKGERERMLKNRASFVRSDRSSAFEDDERMTRIEIESREAVERHRLEMKTWTSRRSTMEPIQRNWLYDLRNVCF